MAAERRALAWIDLVSMRTDVGATKPRSVRLALGGISRTSARPAVEARSLIESEVEHP